MDDPDLYQRRRQTFLAVFLAALTLFGLLIVFTILTGGFLLYVLLVLAVAGGIGGMHYLLWGRAYTERTAGEREELEAQERAADDDDGWLDETRRPRHY
jgi:Flp pilus assembly protein TadB